MPRVALDINGRRIEVACDPGQEAHVERLGAFVDRRVRTLAESVGQVGEHRLLVMACLLLADDLEEREKALQGESAQGGAGSETLSGIEAEQAVRTLETVADRLERLAARLEAT